MSVESNEELKARVKNLEAIAAHFERDRDRLLALLDSTQKDYNDVRKRFEASELKLSELQRSHDALQAAADKVVAECLDV